ncbi:hypothetical protein P7C73_g4852, partial [Tremellales sp. Uapishka_1]
MTAVQPELQLERATSHPSLSHSANTASSEDTLPLPSMDDLKEVKRGFGGVRFTKSMQSLKGRNKLDEKRGQPAKEVVSSKPVVPTRPPNPRSQSSFSAFIRRITGKSSSSHSARETEIIPPSSKQLINQATLPVSMNRSRPILSQLDTRDLVAGVNDTRSQSTYTRDLSPPAPIIKVETDPLRIPLPPSPLLLSTSLPPLPDVLDAPAAVPVPSTRNSMLSEPSLKTIRQSGMLSLEGFDFSEAEEEDDELPPLKSSPIASVPEAEILTPTSAASTSPQWEGMLAGSSPPRRSPVGTGLNRKGSSWRKSVVGGLSGTLTRKSTTTKGAPPSSFDAYDAHQKRLAHNRVSCAPTLHSTASVVAEMRGMKDKEQEEMMETFFLS